MAKHRRPEKDDVPLIGAVGALGFWCFGSLTGLHPDGALLGFSGTMFMIWATAEKEHRRRLGRDERNDKQKQEREEEELERYQFLEQETDDE